MKPNIVILSGAGISRESGIQTFRDANGLWHQHNIKTVAKGDYLFKFKARGKFNSAVTCW